MTAPAPDNSAAKQTLLRVQGLTRSFTRSSVCFA